MRMTIASLRAVEMAGFVVKVNVLFGRSGIVLILGFVLVVPLGLPNRLLNQLSELIRGVRRLLSELIRVVKRLLDQLSEYIHGVRRLFGRPLGRLLDVLVGVVVVPGSFAFGLPRTWASRPQNRYSRHGSAPWASAT